jgi:hypothetical protein
MASTTTSPEFKAPIVHAEHEKEEYLDKPVAGQDDATGKIFSIDDSALPDGYFTSPYFLGSMTAIGLSVMCGVAGFSFIAPLLSFVNEDLGPSNDITWVALTYTLTGAVGLMIVGRLTGESPSL